MGVHIDETRGEHFARGVDLSLSLGPDMPHFRNAITRNADIAPEGSCTRPIDDKRIADDQGQIGR
jgi:hypothetical protein